MCLNWHNIGTTLLKLCLQIVAQHLQFYAFTSHENTIVLRGNKTTNPSTAPDIIPQLSYKGVKSISIGDYHCIALTVYGKVYTWGRNLEGSLGFQTEGTGMFIMFPVT